MDRENPLFSNNTALPMTFGHTIQSAWQCMEFIVIIILDRVMQMSIDIHGWR